MVHVKHLAQRLVRNHVRYYSHCPKPVREGLESRVGRDLPGLPGGLLGFRAAEPNYPAFSSAKSTACSPGTLPQLSGEHRQMWMGG